MTDTCLFEAAGHRASAIEDQYGIAMHWSFDAIGLELTGDYGAETVRRRISWSEINRSDHPSHKLEMIEQAVLAGLSS